MTDPDDWAPLPDDQHASHPGELLDAVARPTPANEPPAAHARSVAPSAPEAPAAREPDLVAEHALAALKRRIAAARPATSWIAEVQHREQRNERKLRVARAAARAQPETAQPEAAQPEAAQPVPTRPEPAAPPEPGAPRARSPEPDVDPREQEPWFRALPGGEQERLRAHWWHESHRFDDAGVVVRRRLGRALAHGAGMFFVMSLLQAPLLGGFGLVPVLTAVGAVAAVLAELAGGGRFAYAAAGAVAFVVGMGPMVFLQPLGLMSLMLATYGMGTLGMDSEMRRSGGFRDS
ncbi:MAG TPA: hypothetical protein VFZ65_00275 [Planctomycetota bacterium]|nr:hypothetical protein [Planctomycetota bacterium]